MRLSSLFEQQRFPRSHPTVRAELAAVRDRAKGIALEVWPRRGLEDDPDYLELLELAAELRLLVVHQRRGTGRDAEVFVYVLHADQHWRILAHQVLLDRYVQANGRWSDAAQVYQSTVLGYSEAQIREHLATLRHEHLGWGQQTVFALLDEARRATIARVHGRYLDPTLFEGGLALFVAPNERVIRRDAHRRVGPRTLARLGVEWSWARATFGSNQIVTLEPRHADACNAALGDRVEALTDDGWRAISPAPSRR